MALEQRLSIKLSQKLVMTQSLQQAIKLLQMSRLELESEVAKELLENPALEDTQDAIETDRFAEDGSKVESLKDTNEADFDNKLDNIDMEAYFNDYLGEANPRREREQFDPSETPNFENMVSERPSLQDHLTTQLGELPINEMGYAIGLEIIGNINKAGRLEAELEEIADANEWQLNDVMSVWLTIRDFDPLGIAARNLHECLETQIAHSEHAGSKIEDLLLKHFDLLQKQKYKELMQILKIDRETMKEYLEIIKEFDPEPGRSFAPPPPQYIQPDVYIVKVDGEYVVQLNDEGTAHLRVSPDYQRLMKQAKAMDKDVNEYMKERFNSAKWLIKSLDQRNRTIYKVAESLVRHQRDFFERGIEHMKPLVLREVADDIGMHESTVSRVVNHKYVHTPRGVFELKYFFRSGLASSSGEDVSSLAVKEKIRKLCDEESPNKPYSDATLVKILGREGIQIARRTVAKYREELGIPSSSKRRQKL